jgi:hypothetical protein
MRRIEFYCFSNDSLISPIIPKALNLLTSKAFIPKAPYL